MLILSADKINKSYGTDVILDDVSFSVNSGDRIGIVGPNGAGKTTLLSIIAGETEPTGGGVYLRNGCTVGYLKQKNNFFAGGTVAEEAEKSFTRFHEMEHEIEKLSKAVSDPDSPTFERDLANYTELMDKYSESGGYQYRGELNGVLTSMGFGEDMRDRKISMLSGGERTRLALACMLLRKPDLMMLDEPTNHLDLKMLDWLEYYLKGYRGTLIVVSHDRYFLDRIVTRIFDMRGTHLTAYKGNYSEYIVKRDERLEAMRREYEKQQKEISRQEEMIRRFKQHGTEHLVKRAQSREKRLSHIDRIERPAESSEKMKLSFSADYRSGNDVVTADGLVKSFGEKQLFRNVSFDIKKGERICIIGENGVGKTTLLKIMMGLEEADEGYLKVGHNVNFGYYDQGQLLLNENETVLGEMKNAYHLYTDTQMRSILGRFLFTGDDVFKTVSSLSGGEKARLSLLKLMLSGSNTLILDEPTNHLDIESKEVVEGAIAEFEGTVIIVSHDRYLLSRLPDRILELTPEGIREYKGKFDYYLEKKAELEAAEGGAADAPEAAAAEDRQMSSEEERRLRKEQEAEERRIARKTESLETEINELETGISDLENEMCSPDRQSDLKFLRESQEKIDAMRAELDDKYEAWMNIHEEHQ